MLVSITLDPRSKEYKKTCARCDEEYYTDLPYSAICPECKLTPGPKNHLDISIKTTRRNGRSRLFKS